MPLVKSLSWRASKLLLDEREFVKDDTSRSFNSIFALCDSRVGSIFVVGDNNLVGFGDCLRTDDRETQECDRLEETHFRSEGWLAIE